MTAEAVSEARAVVSKLELTFPVLSDSSLEHIRRYEVLHPKEGIARPSVFLVDREGNIHWRYVGMSAGDRPPIEEVLARVRSIR